MTTGYEELVKRLNNRASWLEVLAGATTTADAKRTKRREEAADLRVAAETLSALGADNARLKEALKVFARCPEYGKKGGAFVIASAVYDDMEDGGSAPRQAYWHWDDFERARQASATAGGEA